MSIERSMRASDRDRERTTEVLRDAYVAGRLALDEFLDRTGAAWSARTWDDLYQLTGDLPEQWRLSEGGSVTEVYEESVEPGHLRKRPFAPLWVVVAGWLVIAAIAHVAAAIPLAITAVVVVLLAARRR